MNKPDFWLTAASMVVGFVAVLLHMTAGDTATLQAAVSNAVVAAFALVSGAVVLWKYLHGVHSITLAQVVTAVQHLMDSPPADEAPSSPQPPEKPPEGGVYVHL
jgi:hypothetical protein